MLHDVLKREEGLTYRHQVNPILDVVTLERLFKIGILIGSCRQQFKTRFSLLSNTFYAPSQLLYFAKDLDRIPVFAKSNRKNPTISLLKR